MLTEMMRSRLEDLALDFTRHELMDLNSFLKMVEAIRGLDDGSLDGLSMVLEDRGNPNRWNMTKVVRHELERRKKSHASAVGKLMANYSSELPAWKDVFPYGKSGTMVPLSELEARLKEQDRLRHVQSRCIYRPTKPQPGDE
jgi:hypothetical protein